MPLNRGQPRSEASRTGLKDVHRRNLVHSPGRQCGYGHPAFPLPHCIGLKRLSAPTRQHDLGGLGDDFFGLHKAFFGQLSVGAIGKVFRDQSLPIGPVAGIKIAEFNDDGTKLSFWHPTR